MRVCSRLLERDAHRASGSARSPTWRWVFVSSRKGGNGLEKLSRPEGEWS